MINNIFNLGSILQSISKSLDVANKVIPIYNKAKPMLNKSISLLSKLNAPKVEEKEVELPIKTTNKKTDNLPVFFS